MEQNTCVICRFWTGTGETADGECRRLAPVQVAGLTRPWPRTLVDDWCHLFAPRGGIPGGRGNRLTNQEIVNHVAEQGGIEVEKLIEQLQTSGLPEPIAEKRFERLIKLGLLVNPNGIVQPGDGKPLSKKNEPEDPEGGADPEPEKKISAPPARRRHNLEPFLPRLRMLATPLQPAGFNEMFTAAIDIRMIGKGTFSKLIGEALRDAKIHRYEAGQFAGKYYFETDIDTP
jgi:hypothetical protein